MRQWKNGRFEEVNEGTGDSGLFKHDPDAEVQKNFPQRSPWKGIMQNIAKEQGWNPYWGGANHGAGGDAGGDGANASVGQGETGNSAAGGESVYTPGMDIAKWAKMAYGDPEEDAKRERQERQRLGILAVGDALRHMGNIYHTTKYAPAQKLSNATQEEYKRQLTDAQLRQQRQQKRAEQILKQMELQEKGNQWKADYDLKRRKDEREQAEQAWKENESKARTASIEAQTGYTQARTAAIPEETELKKKNIESQIKAREDASRRGWANVANNRMRIMRSGSGRGGGGKGGSGTKGMVELEYDGNPIWVRKSALSEENIRALYNQLSDEHADDENFLQGMKTKAQMLDVIYDYYDDPTVVGYLIDFGADLGEDEEEEDDGGGEVWSPNILRVGQGMANTLSSRFKEGIRKNMPKMQQQAAAMKKKQGGKAASGGGKASSGAGKTAPKGKSRRDAAVSEFG